MVQVSLPLFHIPLSCTHLHLHTFVPCPGLLGLSSCNYLVVSVHLMSTNMWSWLWSRALSLPSAGTGTAAFFQRSRMLVGIPFTVRSLSSHVIVAVSSPVLSSMAAIAPPLIFLYQQLAVRGSASGSVGTPCTPRGSTMQRWHQQK